ncbi:MAG: protein kinase [Thermoguttaceae bacterium]
MGVSSPEEFFAVLQKSKLLTPSQLAQARQLAQQSDDPTAIAKMLARRELITRWQAGQLLAGRSSFYLGKYRLIELLGRGGMGNVFLGEHVTMNRRVALKIIARKIRRDRTSVDRFLAEARAVATLDHPNIVQAYSVDNEGERYYIVMEYVEGLDLQRLVEEDGPVECRLAADYVRQAAEGLDHAHRRNMIHCDIKPSNLLVNVQGVVKILDMGLARLVDSEAAEPAGAGSNDQVLGSVDYLAPEQAMQAPDFDCRADVYSLGCTLYFLLTGHPPFPRGSLTERILKHQTQEPPPIRAERPNVPAELAAICVKMMAKRPEDRYQSAAEVAESLTQWRAQASSRLKRAVPLVRAQRLDERPAEHPRGLGDGGGQSGEKGIAILQESATPSAGTKSKSTVRIRVLPTMIVLLLLLAGMTATLLVFRHGGPAQRGHEGQRAPGIAAAPRSSPESAAAGTQPRRLATPVPTADVASPRKPEPAAPASPASMAANKSTPAASLPAASGPPKPAASSAEKPSPASKQAASPKPRTPPKIEPFREFPDAVELPPLMAADAEAGDHGSATLGRVHLTGGSALNVELVGGGSVGHRCAFLLEPDARDLQTTAWRVRERTEGELAGLAVQHDIARLRLDGPSLTFTWLREASKAAPGRLANCGLLLSVGAAERFVALGRPQTVSPLVLTPDHPVTRVTIKRSDLPDPATLRLQLVGFGAALPHSTMPSDTAAFKKKIEVTLDDPKLPRVVLQIRFEPKPQSVQVECSMLCQLPGQPRLRPLRVKEIERQAAQADFAFRQASAAWAAIPATSQDARRLEAKENLKEVSATKAQLDALTRLCATMGKNGTVHFRLFARYGKRQVTLASTPLPAKATSPDR